MGYGGALIWSGLVRNIILAHPDKCVGLFYSPSPKQFLEKKVKPDHEVYDNNPHIAKILDKPRWLFRNRARDPQNCIWVDQSDKNLHYWAGQNGDRIHYKTGRHAIQYACEGFGVECRELRPAIYLRADEVGNANLILEKTGLGDKPYLCIEPNVQSAVAVNKQWPWENWCRLMELFQATTQGNTPHMAVVQIGAPGSVPLPGCVYLAGKMSFRETAAVIQKSCGLITYVGALMHLAKAVGRRSWVVCSAWEPKVLATYPDDTVFYKDVECKHCGLLVACPHQNRCLTEITPEEVCDRITKDLAVEIRS